LTSRLGSRNRQLLTPPTLSTVFSFGMTACSMLPPTHPENGLKTIFSFRSRSPSSKFWDELLYRLLGLKLRHFSRTPLANGTYSIGLNFLRRFPSLELGRPHRGSDTSKTSPIAGTNPYSPLLRLHLTLGAVPLMLLRDFFRGPPWRPLYAELPFRTVPEHPSSKLVPYMVSPDFPIPFPLLSSTYSGSFFRWSTLWVSSLHPPFLPIEL